MKEPPLRFIAGLAERRIAEAQEAGEFDNLPGHGKPLELEDDSHMLENPEDEQLKIRQMRKLEVMLLQARTRHKRSLALEQADPYYEKVIRRISVLGGRSMKTQKKKN